MIVRTTESSEYCMVVNIISKITVKFIQRYNNKFATYHALINLKGGLIQTPPKSQFMQSTHKMWPKCIS